MDDRLRTSYKRWKLVYELLLFLVPLIAFFGVTLLELGYGLFSFLPAILIMIPLGVVFVACAWPIDPHSWCGILQSPVVCKGHWWAHRLAIRAIEKRHGKLQGTVSASMARRSKLSRMSTGCVHRKMRTEAGRFSMERSPEP